MKWIEIDTNIEGYGHDIIYANEKYYIAHQNPSGVAHSTNLKEWIEVPIDQKKLNASDIAYGNGKFILVGSSGAEENTYIATSEDGINWDYKKIDIQTSSQLSLNLNTCKFINNRFIFIGAYYRYNSQEDKRTTTYLIYETSDGTNIKIHKFISTTDGRDSYGPMDISYNNKTYVLVGDNGLIMTSENLDNWTIRNSGTNNKLVGISFGKGLFVVTGANGTILISSDGINWEKQNSNTSSYLIRSRYDNGLYVAVGYNGTVLTSINAIDWVEENDPFHRTIIYGLAFNNNRYVISAGKYTATGTIPIAYADTTREISYSEDDALYIFDKNLNFKGVIDEFISLRWRRKYYEAGEFELVVAPYENNLKLLMEKDNIIIRQNYTEAALIDTISINESNNNIELNCSGRFLSYVTKRRIIKKKINFSGNVIDGQKFLLRNMTPLTNKFEIEPTVIQSENIVFQCTYKNVYDYLCKLSKFSNIGFRIVPNVETKVFRYENFEGLDRTIDQNKNERYAFTKMNANIRTTNYIDTSVNKCNSVLVGGAGEDSDRILIEIKEGNPTGFDLFETFLDAKNESNKDVSEVEYQKILSTKGKDKIQQEQKSIEVTVDTTDYKKKWDLGDIVNIQDERFNIVDIQRIVEIEEIIENGKREVYLVFGTPLPETISLEND